MNSAVVILRQIVIMFCYLAVGYLMFRRKLVTKEGSKSLANVLLYVSLPCVIIKSFCISNTEETRQELFLSLIMGLVLLLLSMVVSGLLFHRRPLENFGAAFSNAGFMGIPLITATIGEHAVFYTAGMIAFLNILQWTYGQWLLGGKTAESRWKKLLCNPLSVGLLVGLCIYFGHITLPSMATSCLTALAGLNAPLAMIILGVYLAQAELKKMFQTVRNYWVCAVRLLIIPLMTIALLCLLPDRLLTMKEALLVAACTPIGSNVAVYAQKLDRDYTYAVQLVCLSTLLSVVSMPLMIGISSFLWH